MARYVVICIVVLIINVICLNVGSVALGASWEVKTIPLPAGALEGAAFGISCTSTKYCAAVGHSSNGSIWGAAGAEWNGTSWSEANVQANPGNKNGDLRSVWCWAEKHCSAAGTYGYEGIGHSLIETPTGSAWKQVHSTDAHPGKNDEFKGIACISSSQSCTATGEYLAYVFEGGDEEHISEEIGAVFADHASWLGSEEWYFSLEPIENPGGQKNGQMQGISCVEEICITAGGWGQWEPKEGRYVSQAGYEMDNSSGIWTASAVPEPAGAKYGMLYGISCKSITFCMAVGAWSGNVSSAPYQTFADKWNGSTWTNVLWKGGSEGATEGALHGVSCPAIEECEMVGSDKSKAGEEEALIYRWNKGVWTYQKAQKPSGASSWRLEGISCTAVEACNAVGVYGNGKVLKPFGEVY